MSNEMSSSVTLNSACRLPGLSRLKHGPDLEATLAVRELAPVAGDHDPCSRQKGENLLIVAVAMNANAAFGLQDVQIHVVDRHGIFVSHRRTLLPAGIARVFAVERLAGLAPRRACRA
jgi:hypothetical protein